MALDFFAEISEQMLPSGEPSERFFRLLLAVLESLREGGEGAVLRAVNYFSLWAVRLSGWLPELYACLACGGALDEPGERAFFSRGQPGLTCGHCRRTWAARTVGIERGVARLAAEMLRRPVGRGLDRVRHGFTKIFGAADRSARGTEADHGAHVGNLMPSFQDIIFKLKRYWADRGCIIQEPYDVEVGAGTMCPETFLRVLGPKPYRVAYVQPSRRPADGRYGDNPNRLYKHSQLQVILKPSPDDIIEQYLGSLEAIGIDLREHDIKFEEDNWEAPTLGAWGIGWQVMLDGLEITQFTYFQQCGGIDLDVVPAEITYGLERLTAFLQVRDSVYDIEWTKDFTYRDVRYLDELQYSVYNFEMADIATLWKLFDLHEGEATRLLKLYDPKSPDKQRFPLLPTYDHVLKCSNLFNTLDARGAISVTERVGVIQRVRKLAVGVAQAWADQQQPVAAAEVAQ